MSTEKRVAPSAERKPRVYRQIRRALAAAAQAIITAPVKLPPKVVSGAKYVALVVGILDALHPAEQEADDEP